MALSFTTLTQGGTSTDNTVFGTGTFQPTANALVLAAIANISSNNSAVEATAAGNNLSWITCAASQSSQTQTRLTIYRALGAAPTNSILTFTFSETQQNVAWQVWQVTGTDITGTNGSGAIAQSAASYVDPSGSALTVLLNAFGDAVNNAAFVLAANPTSAATALFEASYVSTPAYFATSPNWNVHSGHTIGEDTAVGITYGAASINRQAIAIEIKAAAAAGGPHSASLVDGPNIFSLVNGGLVGA